MATYHATLLARKEACLVLESSAITIYNFQQSVRDLLKF